MSRIVDVYPVAGTFKPGTQATVLVVVEGEGPVVVDYVVMRLTEERVSGSVEVASSGHLTVPIRWDGGHAGEGGYGVDVTLLDGSGTKLGTGHTAFDVLESWTAQPRYGFLSDFGSGGDDPATIVEDLVKFHVNGIQFYDWQYRHDDPLPPQDDFDDPLGRSLSASRIWDLVEHAHKRGIAAMAYLAVYAASVGFWENHQDWALFDEVGNPISFEHFLGLMDPQSGGRWAEHLHGRIDDVLATTAFDGIHIDQYGDPRVAFDALGGEVDLPRAFADFVVELKARHPDRPTTFNAVKNWPIDELVGAPMDFAYIEVWPDTPSYSDLAEIVGSARRSSGFKPVVIALYIPATHEANVRMANAVIAANGGSRIEIGEGRRLLTDPYFPKHEAVSEVLYGHLRRSADFRVRYGSLLYTSDHAETLEVEVPPNVMKSGYLSGDHGVVNLVNTEGLGDVRWNEPHDRPKPLIDPRISIGDDRTPVRVWTASPDWADPSPQELSFTAGSGKVDVCVPRIEFWTVVVFEFSPSKAGS